LALGVDRRQELPGEIKNVCAALDGLVLDELAKLCGGEVVVPFAVLPEIDEQARSVLSIPGDAELTYTVNTRGISSEDGFQIVVEVHHEDHGRLEGFVDRKDNAYLLGETDIVVVGKDGHELLSRVEKGWDESGEPARARMVYQERVKRSAKKCDARLDGFMANEDYILPGDASVAPVLEPIDDTTVAIRPSFRLPGGDGEQPGPEAGPGVRVDAGTLESVNDQLARSEPEPVITVSGPAGKRTRAVIGEEEKKIIGAIKDRRTIEGADIPRMLDNPESVLPEGLDLSDFSERVTGIGIKRLTVTPSISVYSREGGVFEFEGRVGVSNPSFGDSSTDSDVQPTMSIEELEEIASRAREQGEDYVLYNGRWIGVDQDTVKKFVGTLRTLEEKHERHLVDEKEVEGFLEILANIGELQYEGDGREYLERIAEAREVDKNQRFLIPKRLLCEELLEHQKVGYLWLRSLEEKGFGGLLADDMGLGKTLQAICLMGALKEQGRVSPSLVVVPQSLIENWKREISRFYPELTVRVHAGPERARGPNNFEQATADVDITITTYGILRRDQVIMGRVDWRLVVLDEAHEIKNPAAIASTACRGFKARTRLALTGTPVQNGLSELWSIMDFVQPGHLRSYEEFKRQYELPIQKGGDQQEAEQRSKELRERISSICLRRLKVDELDGLPEKREQTIQIEMSDRQASMYEQLLVQARGAGSGKLGYITKLIQLCSHPVLLIRDDYDRSVSELEELCPKFARTMELVDEIQRAGERVLVFTEYKAMQELLVRALQERFGIWAARINGDVMSSERQAMVDRLNRSDGFDVMVLSPTAGGVGLNITGANHVIHYTRVWNPAKEAQATDRAYRIGQKKDVNVYYPIVRHPEFDTVEVRMDGLLARKKELARDIIRPGGGLELSKSEITELLGG